jgi:sulfatase modifying factor 1
MGSPASESGRGNDEGPQHEVRHTAFSIGQYELTFDEYDTFCWATGRAKPADSGWGRGKRPVINVSWNDAVEYCNWRSTKEGLKPCYTINGASVSCDFSANGYRLPTEAEWEYAAKGRPQAGSLASNAVYAGSAELDSVAWYSGNSGKKTQPVGQKRANALGLYDMAGNVWEWCWDWYAGDYYRKSPSADPTGASSGGGRVRRGGDWFNDASNARSANRDFNGPGYRFIFLGFRVLRRP